jgi:hypothetical protein
MSGFMNIGKGFQDMQRAAESASRGAPPAPPPPAPVSTPLKDAAGVQSFARMPFHMASPVMAASPVAPIAEAISHLPQFQLHQPMPIQPVTAFQPPMVAQPVLPTLPVRPMPPGGFQLPPGGLRPPRPFPLPLPRPDQTATELARSAIVTLSEASREVLEAAVNTVRIRRDVEPPQVLDFMTRRVRVNEVLNNLAPKWSDVTRRDFADAFQMPDDSPEVMDAVVAIGILNNPDLEEELRAENTPSTSEQDLLDNRVIVDQWPPAGTMMQPPYVYLVAVEYRDVAGADDVVRSIMDQLQDYDGTKLPRAAVAKLRGR